MLPLVAALLSAGTAQAQVSAYTFTQEVGVWQPIAGSGTPIGMPGLPAWMAYDDNSFVNEGENLPLGSAITGTGWPIGFEFHFNGHVYDRVGLSTEGWLSFGHSSNGANAVYVPSGAAAYTPLSSPVPEQIDPLKRNRVAGFSMDLAAQGNGGVWPLQLHRFGAAPNRVFVVEWNLVRSGGSNPVSFQVRLSEGGGDPAAQTVKVIYGAMSQSIAMLGQVGLGGDTPEDFNNRSLSASPFNWQETEAGASNVATCRLPSSAANIPAGLTFTWTPPSCAVSAVRVADLAINAGVISATLSWGAVTGATSYDYVVTAGGPNDPAILSGTGITVTSVELGALPADQELFAYVSVDCGDGNTGWASGYPFSTARIVELICGEEHHRDTHCYADLEETSWLYTSSDGSPLRLVIHAGTISNGDVLRVYDGPTDGSPVLFSSNSGPIAGQIINSTGGHLTMKLVADAVGSCAIHDFILPMEWEVGCVDCNPIFAVYEVIDNCEQQQFNVQVTVASIGTATEASISSTAGTAPVPVSGPGVYTVGPFAIGTPVVVSVDYPGNSFCNSTSGPLLNGNCPVVGCGPDTYTYCYEDNDDAQFGYTSGTGERIGVRFRRGSLATADQLRVYDGTDVFSSTLLQSFVATDLSGRLVTSSATSSVILLEAASNNAQSCATGAAREWEYVVACYDGCAQPVATYTVEEDCAGRTYVVRVAVTSTGTAATVNITNNADAPVINGVGVGSYTVGPFATGQRVVVDVEGSSVLCSTNSMELLDDCATSVAELGSARLVVFPNPGEGIFSIRMPDGFGGRAEMDVLDLSGRRVMGESVRANAGGLATLALDHLPVGSYVLRMNDGARHWVAAIQIVR